MSDDINKDIAPLLTTTDLNQTRSKKVPLKKSIIIIVVLLAILVFFGTLLILLNYFDIWPFEKQSLDIRVGLYGKYPIWGGNLKNQQTPPSNTIVLINKGNIKTINKEFCVYNSFGSDYNYGVTVIDDIDHGYITDGSGYVTSIDLNNNCSELWRINIGEALGYNFESNESNERLFVSRNGMTIYMNKQSIKSLIIGTPNHGNGDGDGSCWIFSLNANNGELIWKLNIRDIYNEMVTMNDKSFLNITSCTIHGVTIDGQYGYTGLRTENSRGRFMKMDLENQVLVDTFYTISSDIYDLYTETDIINDNYYYGASPWNWPAIIDDYILFGTGNLYNFPKYVEQCIINNNNSYLIHKNHSFNACGQDMSEMYPRWKCNEEGVYQDSFHILNHKTNGINNDKFKHIKSIPLLGVDIWNHDCNAWGNNDQCEFDVRSVGSDSDIVAIAAYHDADGSLYGAGLSKSGMFVVFDLLNGDLKISKKVGISSEVGGGEWSLAVDENSLIAIATVVGGEDGAKYRSILANNKSVCNSGIVHAIDLRTGYTIWQSPNPYAIMNESCENINDDSHPLNYDNYIDFPVEFYGVCETDFDENNMKPAHETAFDNVTYIDLDSINVEHQNISDLYNRSKYFGPVNIANNMVFVPSYTGDVFVHDLLTGHYIHRLQCIDYWDDITEQWNRPGIHGGVTVSEKFIIFSCGASYYKSVRGNELIVFRLEN